MQELVELFEDKGVLKRGHFILTSGKHSNLYVNKDAIWTDIQCAQTVVGSLCEAVQTLQKTMHFDFITGPAMAGIPFAVSVAYQLQKPFIYPEKDSNGNMVYRRGFDYYAKGRRGLIIEDIITTGGSVTKTVDALAKCGSAAVAVLVIWNRTDRKPLERTYSLISESVPSYSPEDCPACKAGIPLTNPKEG